MQIKIKNNTFRLLPQKAIFWEEARTLLLSDLHIGKISHFRKEGIPIPRGGLHENFTRLDAVMEAHPVERVVFVGDLFHSTLNEEWNDFCRWRGKYGGTDMHIVMGNHDLFPPRFYAEICLTVHETEMAAGPFTLAHHPKKTFTGDEYVISGHIHPVIRLYGKANQRLRFPCFYFGARQALLPSFGYFTGGAHIQPQENDRVVAVVNDTLVEIPVS